MKLPVKYDDLHFYERRLIREEYVKVQNGLCHHCKSPLSGEPSPEIMAKKIKKSVFPVGFFKWPVHLHHSHNTGMTIGAVHNYCNAVLWQYHNE